MAATTSSASLASLRIFSLSAILLKPPCGQGRDMHLSSGDPFQAFEGIGIFPDQKH